MKNAKVLKICCSEWGNASRDKRELSVCRELGAEVSVLAKGEESAKGNIDYVDGFQVYRYSTRPLGKRFPNSVNRMASIVTWAFFARTLRADVISGHDLPGLTIGWLSTWGMKNKPQLVYDSHEFEMGRNVKRNRLSRWAIKHWEHFLMKRCVFSIMVNDSIADEVQRIHKLKERPIVVRSTPDNWEIEPEACKAVREEFLEFFGGGYKLLLMYHGAVCRGRGIETLIEVITRYEDVRLIILGNAESENYRGELLQKTEMLHTANKVLFREAVPIEELWKYIGAVDVSMATISPVTKSYYYALPNKLFESIQAGIPIIASDLPEMKKIVEKYQIGLVCIPDDVEDICRCVDVMQNNAKQYAEFKRNLQLAKADLCWEQEKKILMHSYQKILQSA